MAGLRIFVSSTCYDLSAVRGQLRIFIQSLGHEPIMSDFSDVLYDPRIHTHSSCVDEVNGCDLVVLLVGSRYGGRSVPEALMKIDFDRLQSESHSVESLKSSENISVTQLEVLKAVEENVPVFTFVDQRVWNDHALYEKNKDKDILDQISFPSVEKPETAKFIFEFINFLRQRTRGNSVHTFSKIQDIEQTLRKQWSSLFQRLLNEQRVMSFESRRIDMLTEQFEDLKTAILTSIGTSNEREVARGVVRFRRLADFLKGLGIQDHKLVLREQGTWDDLLDIAGIAHVIDSSELPSSINEKRRQTGMRARTYMVKEDDTYYELRYPPEILNQLRLDWESFMHVPPDSRAVILDALAEMRFGPGFIRYTGESFKDYIIEQSIYANLEESEGDK